MHAKQVLILAAAGLAAAQSSTSSAASSTSTNSGTSGCGSSIDAIISSCLDTTQSQLDACATNDWDCYCEQSNNVLTCYNNCPSDPRRNGVDQQNETWCNAAKAYGTSSSASMSRTATASGSSGTAMASASASGSESESTATASDSSNSGPSATTSSNSEEASSTESTGAAAGVVIPGSLVAAIFGLAAIF